MGVSTHGSLETCLFQIGCRVTVDAEHERCRAYETSGDDENVVVQLGDRAQCKSNHGATCEMYQSLETISRESCDVPMYMIHRKPIG